MIKRVQDRHWAHEARSAAVSGALLLTALLLLDWGTDHLSAQRGEAWAGLALVLAVVLTPSRVSAGEGWLATRGLLRSRCVRTDELVSVRPCLEGVSQRWILKDVNGARVEIDPRRFVADPQFWHELERGVHVSLQRGTLLCGATAVDRLSRRVDADQWDGIMTASGLDPKAR